MSYIKRNPDVILRSVRSSAERNAKVVDTKMDAKMADIPVSNLWNSEPAIAVQETKNLPATNRNADDLQAPGEDHEFVLDNNRLRVTNSDV